MNTRLWQKLLEAHEANPRRTEILAKMFPGVLFDLLVGEDALERNSTEVYEFYEGLDEALVLAERR